MTRTDNITTPWGRSDTATVYAEGITFYTTPSHGGFRLSPERAEKMPKEYREYGDKWAKGMHTYSGEWYEEDCAALAVIATFHEDIGYNGDIEQVKSMLDYWMEQP